VGRSKNPKDFSGGALVQDGEIPPPEISSLRYEISTSPLRGRCTVAHAKGQYVVGAIYTNAIEGFWSIMKRGIMGTLHEVSRKYVPLYVAEFKFRYITARTQISLERLRVRSNISAGP